MKKTYLIPAFFLLVLASCSETGKTETVTIDGRYSIDLPATFKKSGDLNPDASLQYMDESRELYVVVIDEPKEAVINAIVENGIENIYSPDITGYSNLLADSMKSNLKAGDISPFKDTIVNGLKARKATLEGIVESIRIHYKLTVVDGKNRFYQIMTWTTPERLQKNAADMQAIADSFKETDRSIAKNLPK